MCGWPSVFIVPHDAHLGNHFCSLHWSLLYSSAAVVCCSSTSFNSLSLLCLTLFLCLLILCSFAILLPQGEHKHNVLVLAEHLAPEPIQPDGQYVCSDNVGTQSRLAPARVAVQIGDQRESSFTVVVKKKGKTNFCLFCGWEYVCLHVCGGGRYCWFDLSWQHRRWFSFLKVLKDEEIVPFQLCMMSADGFCLLDNFVQEPNTSWKRRRASKTQQSFCLNNTCWVAGTAGACVSNLPDPLMSE